MNKAAQCRLAARNLRGKDGALVVLYCAAPKNGILISAPIRKMKNFKMEYSVKLLPSLPSLPTSRLDDTQLNWSVTADDHVHGSDVSRKRSYRIRLGSQTMMAVTMSRPSHRALMKAAAVCLTAIAQVTASTALAKRRA
jgi:hypothetical protein